MDPRRKEWVPVRGANLKPGMQIRRQPNFAEKAETVGPSNGQCDQGIHFGSACYSRVSTWYIRA